jgi:transposase
MRNTTSACKRPEAASVNSPCCSHRPDAIDEWAAALRQRFHGQAVAVCLEIARGPLVYALQKHDFFVLFPVNPATLAKYRQAFQPSHAKADPADAQIALEILLCHRDKLKALQPQSVGIRTLERLLEERREFVDEQTRITNRLTSALKEYFPLANAWFDEKASALFCDFLSHWPSLKQLQRARRTTLLTFFREHHCYQPRLIEERLAALQRATPLTDDAAVIKPKALMVEGLVDQLRVTLKAIARFDAEIESRRPDPAGLRAVPGTAGRRSQPGAALAGRFRRTPGALRQRRRCPDVCRRRAGDGKQWQAALGALAAAMPDVPAPDLRRVGRPDHHPFLLGRRLLSATTRQRLRASDRCSGLGLQVDTHSLPLLAAAHAL